MVILSINFSVTFLEIINFGKPDKNGIKYIGKPDKITLKNIGKPV